MTDSERRTPTEVDKILAGHDIEVDLDRSLNGILRAADDEAGNVAESRPVVGSIEATTMLEVANQKLADDFCKCVKAKCETMLEQMLHGGQPFEDSLAALDTIVMFIYGAVVQSNEDYSQNPIDETCVIDAENICKYVKGIIGPEYDDKIKGMIDELVGYADGILKMGRIKISKGMY